MDTSSVNHRRRLQAFNMGRRSAGYSHPYCKYRNPVLVRIWQRAVDLVKAGKLTPLFPTRHRRKEDRLDSDLFRLQSTQTGRYRSQGHNAANRPRTAPRRRYRAGDQDTRRGF